MGRFAIKRLKKGYTAWQGERDDAAVLHAVSELAAEFARTQMCDAVIKAGFGRVRAERFSRSMVMNGMVEARRSG